MNLALGKEGEKIAEIYLRNKGFKVLERNYRTPLGEIDLICLDEHTITFVEVKTNSTTEYGTPELRVDHRKQKQMIKAALSFLKQKDHLNLDCRFDVVSILAPKGSKPDIQH